jgi:hypothetical protein
MPDHLHIVAVPGGEDRLRRVLSAYTARFGVQFDILEPEPANSAAIAKRMIRYGFFNPIRAGLVGDPWSWSWSTLRDLSDAIYPAWTSLPGLAERLGGSTSTLLHSLTTLGEHRPTPPKRGGPLVASMEAVRSAVASALRLQPADVHGRSTSRVLFVQASEAVGHPSVRTLADALGCTERSIRRYRTPQHPALDAALLCLADPRLREP